MIDIKFKSYSELRQYFIDQSMMISDNIQHIDPKLLKSIISDLISEYDLTHKMLAYNDKYESKLVLRNRRRLRKKLKHDYSMKLSFLLKEKDRAKRNKCVSIQSDNDLNSETKVKEDTGPSAKG